MKHLKKLYALSCIFFLQQNIFGADDQRKYTHITAYLHNQPQALTPWQKMQTQLGLGAPIVQDTSERNFGAKSPKGLRDNIYRFMGIPPREQCFRFVRNGDVLTHEQLKAALQPNNNPNRVTLFVSRFSQEEHIGSY